jgi:MFS family permease
MHYAWVVAGVTFLVLLVTAGIRATPGVLMVPLEAEFGWTSAAISVAIAINLALFGLIGPFAASLMDRWGLRRLVLCALALLTGSVALTTVPPTIRLASDAFGRENAGVIYGWIGASHQLGAALAAIGAGSIRTAFGDYRAAFWIAGTICFLTGFAFLFTGKALGTRLPVMEAGSVVALPTEGLRDAV